ncbi:MAG: hypothetical protein EOO29_56730, partial [Comamonadaceae bacterium]
MSEADPDSGERLAKRVAAQLHCSRREAEQLVAQGAVTVDGEAATQPQQRVRPEQRVAITPGAQPQAMVPGTLLVHKPAGLDWNAPGFWGRTRCCGWVAASPSTVTAPWATSCSASRREQC